MSLIVDSGFPDHQFKIEGYQFPPFRRDRNSKGGGKSLLLRKSAAFYLLTVLQNSRKFSLFEEISVTLSKALNKYDNLLLAGDLYINTLRPTSDSSNHLSDLNDTFSLTNLVTDSTCFKSNKCTLIDLMLTNKPKSFYKSHSFVTGLSDCHKLIVSILRTSFQKPPPKFVIYRNKKNFHESNFFRDLDSRLIQG